MKKLIAGNWKMNMNAAEVDDFCRVLRSSPAPANADLLLCSPYVYLERAATALAGSEIKLGAQDCAAHDNGAYTGDISARMLCGIGASHVILGHSERRQYHAESDSLIAQKITRARDAGLITTLCVGETLAEREQGMEKEIVARQITGCLPADISADHIVIAYEPVWAIGTGKTATPRDAQTMHAFIRSALPPHLAQIRILYGGSMNENNAAELLAQNDIDGGLIGGASLKPESFLKVAGQKTIIESVP